MIERKSLVVSAMIAFTAFSCTPKSSEPKSTETKQDSQKVIETKNTNKVRSASAVDAIEGLYIQKPYEEGSGECNLTINIEKINDNYYYTLSLQDSVMKGRVTVVKNSKKSDSEYAVTLEGIEWASYEGDISDESKPPQEPEIPVGIGAVLSNNELTFQNYGNSMNSYTVLDGCDQKYIRLVKQ